MQIVRIALLSVASLAAFVAIPTAAEANYWQRQARQNQRYWNRQGQQMHRQWNRGARQFHRNHFYGPRAGWGRPGRGVGIGVYW